MKKRKSKIPKRRSSTALPAKMRKGGPMKNKKDKRIKENKKKLVQEEY